MSALKDPGPMERYLLIASGILLTAALAGLQTEHCCRMAAFVSRENLQALWGMIEAMNPTIAMGVILALLFLAGCGLPLPEDIPLTFSGILLSLPSVQDHFGGFVHTMMLIGVSTYTAILMGDLVAYSLGRRYGDSLARWPLLRAALKPKRRKRMQRWFRKYGNGTVFLGRMVAGVRFVTFVSAGIAHMPVLRFIIFDSMAALITVPAWLFLGFMVGTHFDKILVWISRVNTTTWIVLGAAVVVFLLLRWRLKKNEPADDQDPTQA